MNNNGANDLTVRIENSTDPKRMRVILEIPCNTQTFNISVNPEHETDLLKVLDALCGLDFFTHADGTPIPKAEVFRIFGLILSIEMLHVNQRLNYAYRLNTCTRVFFLMTKYAEKRHNS